MRGQPLRYSFLWLSCLLAVHLQSQTLSVIDENEDPLIGVYVTIDNSRYVTDEFGKLDHTFEEGQSVLLEYLGYDDLSLSYQELVALNYRCQMSPAESILEEIVVIGRTNAREIDLPYKVDRISADDIFGSNAQNSADAIALNSNAFMQKSQLGGGSPVLRGFEANKILLVVDGVRMNNAIYRNGHLQNAITIDPAILQQMEVIYGPGSLIYGSEALGGVVHFRTRDPLLTLDNKQSSSHTLNAILRTNTADQEKTAHLDHTFSTKKFGILSSMTYTDREDLRTGSRRREAYPDFGKRISYAERIDGEDVQIDNPDPDIQIGTAYNQLDLLTKIVYQANAKWKTKLNLQYSTSGDIPRYDNLSEGQFSDLRFAEWYYGPQKRLLISPTISYSSSNKLMDKAQLILSFQDIEESRISRNFGSDILEKQIETVQVYGLTLDLNKRINDHHKLTYGIDMHRNQVGSEAVGGNIITPSNTINILTRYPSGGSDLTNYGAYVQYNYQNKDSTIVWSNGLRWTSQTVNMNYDRSDPFTWPEYFYAGIKSTNSAAVGISGLNIQSGPYELRLSSGTAFRSPNVDDLAKIRVNRDEITVPNPELISEKVWNNEMTLGYKSKSFTVGLTGFYTILSDAIIRESATLPDGEPIFISSVDTLIVTANTNAASGSIRGLSINFSLSPVPDIMINSAINFQKGIAKDSDNRETPLGHIAPTYGRTNISWDLSRLRLSAITQYNLWKDIEDYGGSVDNPDLATIDGSPSWITYGIQARYDINHQWSINCALENITDIHYRPFSSGVSSAGRHLSLALRYKGSRSF